jgi:hypothetical protein
MIADQIADIHKAYLIPNNHPHSQLLLNYSILGIRLILYFENTGSISTTSSFILSLKHQEEDKLKIANQELEEYKNITK